MANDEARDPQAPDVARRLRELEDERGRAVRDARRGRMLARLVRDAYRLADRAASPSAIAHMICDALVEDGRSTEAALLRRLSDGPLFGVLATAGLAPGSETRTLEIASPSANAFAGVLDAPHSLRAYDEDGGYALIVGGGAAGADGAPYEAADQEFIDSALSLFIDVLTRKQNEMELRQAKLEAEAAGRAQARFLAKLSHELRTPLNAILGFSEMIGMARDYAFGLERCMAYGRDINESGTYLLALIDDILDFSAFGLEEPTLATEAVDVLDLVAKASQILRPAADQKGVSLEVDLTTTLPDIWADPIRIRQAVLNLLENAVRFTPAGGRVRIGARHEEAANAVWIEVTDTGVGIDPADIPRAFEPFVQLHDGPDLAHEGVGLGLAIAKALVEAHGGALTLASAPSQGVAARISLPCVWATPAAEPRRAGGD